MARQDLRLKTALRSASPLQRYVRDGAAAIAKADLRLVAEGERARIGDSLNLDAASRDELPQLHRWDYIVSVPDLAQLVGLEPHAAKDSEVSVVIAKKQQAAVYLRSHLEDGRRVTRWFWVTSGPVGFSRMDRARRRLDQNGIAFVGRQLRSFG